MFLSMITEEEKKELFLELCIYTSNSDGNLDENEREMMSAYCEEMRYENEDMICKHTIEEVLDLLKKKCSRAEKRIILIELVGLVLADKNFANEEEKILVALIEKFEISMVELEEVKGMVKRCMDVYDGLLNFITVEK